MMGQLLMGQMGQLLQTGQPVLCGGGTDGTANTDGTASADRVAAITKSPPVTVAQSLPPVMFIPQMCHES